MKRTSSIQRKESNKIISTLTSIMVLMVIMIWTAPADAGRLAPVQKKVTSIKRAPLMGKTVASRTVQKSSVRSIKPVRSLIPQRNLTSKRSKSTVKAYTKPGVRKSTMSSTRSLGVDVNGGGSGGISMPGVSRDPSSCKDNPLLSPLMRQRNCKKLVSVSKPICSKGFVYSFGARKCKKKSAPTGSAPTGSAPTATGITSHVVCHYEWIHATISQYSLQGKLTFAINGWEKLAEWGWARKVCVNEPL